MFRTARWLSLAAVALSLLSTSSARAGFCENMLVTDYAKWSYSVRAAIRARAQNMSTKQMNDMRQRWRRARENSTGWLNPPRTDSVAWTLQQIPFVNRGYIPPHERLLKMERAFMAGDKTVAFSVIGKEAIRDFIREIDYRPLLWKDPISFTAARILLFNLVWYHLAIGGGLESLPQLAWDVETALYVLGAGAGSGFLLVLHGDRASKAAEDEAVRIINQYLEEEKDLPQDKYVYFFRDLRGHIDVLFSRLSGQPVLDIVIWDDF